MMRGFNSIWLTMVALVLLGYSSSRLPAQSIDEAFSRRLGAPSSVTNVPFRRVLAGDNEWSGQSGASGHPLMMADAISAAAAEFGDCLAALWPQAAQRGVTREFFEHYTAGLRVCPDTLGRITKFSKHEPN